MRRARETWGPRFVLRICRENAFALGAGAVLLLLIYGLTRTPLFFSALNALGAPVVLALAILLLIVLTGLSLAALTYGFGIDDPLRRRRRHRRSPE